MLGRPTDSGRVELDAGVQSGVCERVESTRERVESTRERVESTRKRAEKVSSDMHGLFQNCVFFGAVVRMTAQRRPRDGPETAQRRVRSLLRRRSLAFFCPSDMLRRDPVEPVRND
jgi:hypothetical protein